eukprot:Tamp_01724.p1 GENE.Tamp_01724~~Tamp_01724.p1  ORF type:complete len:1170 (-),score=148.26 Tamp_01724:1483-4506(-)
MGPGGQYEAGQQLRPMVQTAVGVNVTVRLRCVFETVQCLQTWLVGVRTVPAVNTARNGSVAEFNLHITRAGVAYVLVFSAGSGSTALQAVSHVFTVHGAAPVKLEIVRSPEPRALVHAAIPGNPRIAAQDRFGNSVVGVRIKARALLVDSPYLSYLNYGVYDFYGFVDGETSKETEIGGTATFGNIVLTQPGNYSIEWVVEDAENVRTPPQRIMATTALSKVIRFLINEDWTAGWLASRSHFLRIALGKICDISPLYFRMISATPAEDLPGYLIATVGTAIPASLRRAGASLGELEMQGDKTRSNAEAEQQLEWQTVRQHSEGIHGDVGSRRKPVRYPELVGYITADMNPPDGEKSMLVTAGVRGVLFDDGEGLGMKFEVSDGKDDVSVGPDVLSVDTAMVSLVMSATTGACAFLGAVFSLAMSIEVAYVETVALSSDFFFVRQLKVASMLMIEQLQFLGVIKRIGNGLETRYLAELALFSDGFDWANLKGFKMLPRILGNLTRTDSELTAEEMARKIQCDEATNEWLVTFLSCVLLLGICVICRVALLTLVMRFHKRCKEANVVPFMLRRSAWSGPLLLMLPYAFFGVCARAISLGCLGPTLLSCFIGFFPMILLFGTALYRIRSTRAYTHLHARVVLRQPPEDVPRLTLQWFLWTINEKFEARYPGAVVTESQGAVFDHYGWFFEDYCYRGYHWGTVGLLKKLVLIFVLNIQAENINITCVMFLLGVDALLFILVRPYFSNVFNRLGIALAVLNFAIGGLVALARMRVAGRFGANAAPLPAFYGALSLAVLSWIFLMLTLAYVCYRSFLAFRYQAWDDFQHARNVEELQDLGPGHIDNVRKWEKTVSAEENAGKYEERAHGKVSGELQVTQAQQADGALNQLSQIGLNNRSSDEYDATGTREAHDPRDSKTLTEDLMRQLEKLGHHRGALMLSTSPVDPLVGRLSAGSTISLPMRVASAHKYAQGFPPRESPQPHTAQTSGTLVFAGAPQQPVDLSAGVLRLTEC